MKADPVPKTPAADAALSVATRFYSPALLNHSLRCHLWGAMCGAAHGIAFDDELYYVSALLHDVGLTETFDSQRLPFEDAGAQLAWVFGVAAGWPGQRAARVAEIIVLRASRTRRGASRAAPPPPRSAGILRRGSPPIPSRASKATHPPNLGAANSAVRTGRSPPSLTAGVPGNP